MHFTSDVLVADVATHNPVTIPVFQQFGIDFCCGGKRSLAAACDARGLSFEDLRLALEDALAEGAEAAEEPDWSQATVGELIQHVETYFHRRLRQELPRLDEMAAKVLNAHGTEHPYLVHLAATFHGLREELESHLLKEERVLFPAIGRRMSALRYDGSSLDCPIAAIEHEHQEAGAALARLRELTRDFTPPAGACPTWLGLYDGLARFDRELQQHIHLENNVLFPRAAALDAAYAI